ncbi:ribonuclease H-like domain-containing protein [Tanacetum coccineum]
MKQESTKKQKVDEDKDTVELQSLMEVIPDEEEVAIDVVPLAIKFPSIVGWKIHKEGKKSYYQITRADRKSQMYRIFSHMLKSFSREDLYKLVKAKYESTRPVEDLDFSFLEDATCVHLHAGRKEISLYTIYNYKYVEQEASGVNAASEEVSTAELVNMEDDVDINALTIEQYIASIPDDIKPGIVNPKIGNDVEFEINANFMRELRRKIFISTDNEDAYEHVRTVLEIVDLFYFPSVTYDAIMLRVFPITLKGRALRWKNRLPAGTITTWDLLKNEFIWRYCHPFITAKKLDEICNFKQERDETLYHAWERYNDLLYQCSLHDLNCQ